MLGRFDPDYWQRRAAEARAMAAQLTDDESKRITLGIADGYEQMARAAERIQASREVLSRAERSSAVGHRGEE